MQTHATEVRHARFWSLHSAYLAMKPKRVLLNEPDAEARGRLASTLRSEGFEVTEVDRDENPASYVGQSATTVNPFSLPDLIVTREDEVGIQMLSCMNNEGDWPPVILLAGAGALMQGHDVIPNYVFFGTPADDEIRLAALNLVNPS
jgi:hypothetical protein